MEERLPPGFRFHPTDEELITCYLSPKVLDFRFVAKAIVDVDLNKCEPWDLPAKASMGEKEWYFFSQRDRKYPTGLRTNRATDAGYWKTTGKDKEIFRCNVVIGTKKTLVFYRGRAPKGDKTNWVMHEYRHLLQNNHPNEEWVVCRVFKKSSNVKKPPQVPNSTTPSSMTDSPCDTTMSGTEELGVLLDASTSILNNNNNNLLNTTPVAGSFNNNLYMNWMLTSREASSLPSLLPWLGSSSSSSSSSSILRGLMPFNGYQLAMETANMSSLNSSLLGVGGEYHHIYGSEDYVPQQQQQQRQHEPIRRGY